MEQVYPKKRWDEEVAMERAKDASMAHFGIPTNATAEEIHKWQLSYYKKLLKTLYYENNRGNQG